MMQLIFFINTVFLILIFLGSCFLSNEVYYYVEQIFEDSELLLLILSVMSFYVFVILGLALYYRLILRSIKKNECIVFIDNQDTENCKQVLRVVLDTIIIDLISPLRILGCSVPYLKLLGLKVTGHPVVRGKVFNPDIVEIQSGAILGEGAMIFGHSRERNRLIYKQVVIEQNATIGINSVILPGSVIKRGAIIAAGSVVKKNSYIPQNEIWGGTPAKKIGENNN